MTNKENLIIFGSIGLAATAYNSLRLAYFYSDEENFPIHDYKFEQAKNEELLSPVAQLWTFLSCSTIPYLAIQLISHSVHLTAEMPIVLSSPFKQLPRALFNETNIAKGLSEIIRNSSTALQCVGFAFCLSLMLVYAADRFHNKFLENTKIGIRIEIIEDPQTNEIETKSLYTNLALSSLLACGLAYCGKLAR